MPGSRVAFISTITLATTLAACAPPAEESRPQAAADTAAAIGADCEPLETREPNAPEQSPAFPEQTRACEVDADVAFDVTVLADGLEHPWAVEPLPGGDLLVTERPGRLRIISATGAVGQPIGGVPAVDARGQGGLLDVALSPDFASDRTIFWSYAEPRDGGNGTTVARGVLSEDRRRLEQVRVILRALPTYDGRLHFGSRLAFGPDGKLFITT
ncbi:MAG: PQQ-dependent sugar dehydrogenase, partial [Longimicrobiales bacterium]